MELSNDAKRIKEMCEGRRSFLALQIADEESEVKRLGYIRALGAFEEVLSFIARIEKENEINVTA